MNRQNPKELGKVLIDALERKMIVTTGDVVEGLNGIYKTFAQVVSFEDSIKIYENMKGLTVTFPTKLFSAEHVKHVLRNTLSSNGELSKKDIQRIAVKFDYSERQVRRFIKEIKQ